MIPNIVLSIDGGGIKGIIPLQIIRRLKKEFPTFLDHIFFLSGTSTGGIITLGLAAGIYIDKIMDLYLKEGKNIFVRDDFWKYIPGRNIFRAKHSLKPMLNILKASYGNKKLKDVNKDVLIPTFDLLSFRPKHYKNWEDPEEYLYDVAVETAVAPIYFPSHRARIDGGVFSSNPCDSAALEAFKRYPLKEYIVLSLGTGRVEQSYIGGDLGIKQYFYPHTVLLDAMFEGSSHAATYRTEVFMGEDNFRRFNPFLGKNMAMDDPKLSMKLYEIGNEVNIDPLLFWLSRKGL